MATATGTYVSSTTLKRRLGITDSTDDTLIGEIVDEVNQFVESKTGRVLAPITLTAVTFDGYDALENGRLYPFPRGIRTISLLEVASTTGGTFTTVASGDFFLRPVETNRSPGWPATEIWITDIPSGSTTLPFFPPGFANVRITGTGGWAAVPDDIAAAAKQLGVGAWRQRSAGGDDSFTIGSDGERVYGSGMWGAILHTLARYRRPTVDII